MTQKTPRKHTFPFCRQSWRIPALILSLACMATFAWGIHLMQDHRKELRGVDYLPPIHKLGGNGGPPINQPVAPGPGAAINRPPNAQTQQAALGGTSAPLVRASLVSISGATDRNGPLTVLGSGALVGSNGYVATASHLIDGKKALQVRVATPGGARDYPARLLKAIPEHNLALVKIQSRETFAYLTPTDSQLMEPGLNVVAWGDNHQGNVIAQPGVITGPSQIVNLGGADVRGMTPTNAIYHWAQSGGPMVDRFGNLLGVNVMLADNKGEISGFMIPGYLIRAHFRDVINLPPPTGGGAAAKMGQGGAGPPGGPTMQTVALPVATQPPPPAFANASPPKNTADAWWKRARDHLHDTLNLHLPSTPFDFSWLFPDDDPHSQKNQLFGYSIGSFFGLMFLGLISGISGGMMTMGGGIIKVTGLMTFFGYGLVLVRPVAYLTNIFMYGAAALRYKQAGLIDWAHIRPMAPWAIVGMVAGYFIGNLLDASVIRILLGLFAAVLAIKMFSELWEQYRQKHPGPHWLDGEIIDEEAIRRIPHLLREGLLGLPMGLISGLLGITGGVVEVPLQRYVNRVPMKIAIANSAVLVFFASSVGSFVAMIHGVQSGAFEASAPIIMALILLPGAYVGGMIGAWLTTVAPMNALRWIYAILMVVIAARMLMTGF
ncbi:magnetosome protein MamO [Magnetofaba australis]|uniref:Probable membrane transporter protein n=1 Tax=Magnetofaba australis IT-1 TaxID=1434232 RepID=W0LMV9_9PROT|nr:magnetosome protein MamO [Magnetofaba australis]AHG23884.1 MamO [Magnetofaba australis IT-1]OSM08631.1 putative Magnetosome protein MamO [Magnetofaba australis IT-1]